MAFCVILTWGDSKQPGSVELGLMNLKVINHRVTSSANLLIFFVPTS
jgi:hypothetical protein